MSRFTACSLAMFIYTSSLNCNALAAEPTSPVALSIIEVVHLIDRPVKSKKGIATILVKNQGKESIRIPFYSIVGSKVQALSFGTKTMNAIECSVNNGSASPGGQVSLFEYTWIDQKGHRVMSGAHDIHASDMNLAPGGTSVFCAPIEIPKYSGKYMLDIHFDNRPVKDASFGSNSRVLCNEVFFDARTTASVDVSIN